MLVEGRDLNRSMVETSCNTWRCLSCRDRNMRRFKAIVQHGCSVLERCMFITITYKAGSKRLSRAGCVARDWRAFFRLLHREYPETKEWGILRVMELTKKGTPHFHLIAGKVSGRIRCYGKNLDGPVFISRLGCDCWSHRMSAVWKRVQKGESWIVHTIPVASAVGAGAYMGKYLGKEFSQERATVLGMKRRYSVNRKWPRENRVRIVAPGTDGWRRVTWAEGLTDLTELVDNYDYPRSYTDCQLEKNKRRAAKALLKKLGREL